MALLFGNGSSDHLDCGSDVSVDDLFPFTWWLWFKAAGVPLGTGVGPVLISKRSSGLGKALQWGFSEDYYAGAMDVVGLTVDRDGVDATVFTPELGLRFGAWTFIAATFDTSLRGNIYVGTLTSPASEPVGTLSNLGSGNYQSEGAGNLLIGGDGNTFSAHGRIACAGIIAKHLTLDEVRVLQWQPKVTPETRAFYQFLYPIGGPQPDLAGNGNNASLNGIVAYADHVPLGNAFGHDLSVVPVALRRRGGSSPIYYS